jgi:hypothetical protein
MVVKLRQQRCQKIVLVFADNVHVCRLSIVVAIRIVFLKKLFKFSLLWFILFVRDGCTATQFKVTFAREELSDVEQ